MINNKIRWSGLVLALVTGCGQARSATPLAVPLQGVVEYDDRVIGFELGGRVISVGVERGQDVKTGATLASLDDGMEQPLRDLRAADLATAEAQLRLLKAGARGEDLRAAAAEISALQSQEGILQKNVARQQSLVNQSALPQSVVDDTSAQLQATSERKRALEERLKALRSGARGEEIAAAIARVQAATAALAAEDARLQRYTLTNPAAGNVIDVHVKVGEMVAPGAPAITIADLSHPYVDVFVPQARMSLLQVGKSLSVRVDGVSNALPCKVEHIFLKTEFTPRFLFSEGERPNLVLRVRVRVEDPKHELHGGIPAFVSLPDAARAAS
ncbi:MAG TPA: HlyD family efflux transporter periplasmic adaptor subunit [Polyangiales bacterium]